MREIEITNQKKKRVLVLNYEFPPLGGGASPMSYELAKLLSETGDFHIDVVTMGYKGLLAIEKVNDNFTVYRVPSLRSKKEICHPWEQLSYLVSAYFKCRQLLKRNTYDICHTHFIIPTGALSYVLKKQFGLEYVITSHGSDVPGFNTDRFKMLHKFTGPFLRAITRNAKQLISPSQYLKKLITTNISADLETKTVVIPNGIDIEKFTPQTKSKIVFSSGRLLPRKGFQYLIQAVSNEDIGYEVHIAGDGPMMNELQELAEVSKTKVVLHGWLNNTSREYKDLLEQAEVFVLASERENASIVLLEAMAAGCAVITTNITGCAESVGKDGILVPVKDASAIKTAIASLITDQQLMQATQTAMLNRARNVFGWNKIVGEYIKAYENTSHN